MARKIILVTDPGIDGAFAISLALNDPDLEVLALAATAGNVSADQATRNVHVVVEQLDPPRWPRIGAALSVTFERTGNDVNGPDGLGGLDFPCARLHHTHPADKVLTDHVRQAPGEVAVLVLGPATTLARALDRDPELPRLVERIVLVGGSWHEPGDVNPVAEFHFWADPAAARQVLHCGAPITLLPLDVTRKLIFSPGDLRLLPEDSTRTGQFLRRLLPHAIAPTAGKFGIEGVFLNDALAVALLARPQAFTLRGVAADVELRGELTRGMSVFDTRWGTTAGPNIDLATDVDVQAVRQYIHRVLADLRC